MRFLTTTAFLLLIMTSVFAQNAELRGHVYDADREPQHFGVIQLLKDNKTLYLVESEFDGSFQIKGILPGTYLLKVESAMTDKPYTETIRFSADQIQLRDSIVLSNGSYQLKEAEVRGAVSSETKTEIDETIMKKLPGADPESAIALQCRVEIRDGRIEVGKGKTGSTQILGESNIGLIGPTPISTLGLENIQVIDLGISPRLGGFTGGAVAFKTMPISLRNATTYQIQSSSPFNAYHHNLASFYFSRAIKSEVIYDTTKIMQDGMPRHKSRLIFGYSFMGNYKFQKDVNPAFGGYQVATNDAMRRIEEHPLVGTELIGGFVPAATFLTTDDLEYSAIRQNASRHDASGQLKFTLNPTSNLSMDLINSVNYIYRRLPIANNQVFNSEQNPVQSYGYINSQFNITHKLKSPYSAMGNSLRDSNDFLSSLTYSIEINHQYNQSKVASYQHADNIFDYGYVGSFNSIRVPVYTYQQNKPIEFKNDDGSSGRVNDYWALTGYKDSLIGFNEGSQNPELANYTRFIYNSLGSDATKQNLIQRGGLMNGQNLPLLYSLYANPGTVYGNYSKNYQQRFGITAFSEASFHPFRNHKLQHDIEFGLTYQQDRYGSYNLNASSLWQLMPLLANAHISELDKQNPNIYLDEKGRFTDTVSYNILVDKLTQKYFDKNLRAKLMASGFVDANGNEISESSWIDVNSLNPDILDINMFSADELLNNGNGYVSYTGYDHMGNKTNSKKGLNAFLNDPLNRPIDGFNPINMAAWIQDKFVFRNLIMRIGFRFERYDANQLVLKDPFVVFPVRQAGEVKMLSGIPVTHPASIDNDYVVYVNDAANPTSIVGYRKDEQWYDKNGTQISDPSFLANASSSGRIQPMLINPESDKLSTASFRSYQPQNLVLPRISFSFPINRESMVYVSYDKLAQNPEGLNYAPFTTYYYMQSNISGVLPNPDLKARLKTEYNVGFKQHLGMHASLNLSAAYATIRNDFNQYRLEGAYPYSYTTYSNIDFSAVKRYVAEYEYNNNHISLSANYALQFADGTGSNINSAAALIQSGQPNLRSLFPLSYDNRHTIKGFFIYSFGHDNQIERTHYRGPQFGTNQILKDAFISFTFQSISGNPYSATQLPVSEAQASNGVVQRAQLKGNPFGNRMVWRHFTDLRFEKAFETKADKSISAYVVVSNLFNLKIVESVYAYTGLPGDDGYLNSPQGQQQVRNQLDAETFTQLYRLRMNNQNNFGAPRNIQLGLKMNM